MSSSLHALQKNSQQYQLNPEQTIQPNSSCEIIPLTDPYIDSQSRSIRLWKISSQNFFGTVTHINGQISFISSDKIINYLNQQSSIESLQRIALICQRQWDLVYLESQNKIIISPRIIAAGKDDANSFKIRFPQDAGQFRHIFDPAKRNKGHFSAPLDKYKRLLIEMFSDPTNRVATDNHDNGIYFKTMLDGTQLGGALRPNGLINNAGKNFLIHKKWIELSKYKAWRRLCTSKTFTHHLPTKTQ